ncbi:MAG: ADP-dependent NAD(P)H-hydrate dehydratase / NAD(P)H-hydrate epimerase [Clostridiales bacterium]|nr:ADP-dependent NAD(P)H-hydrate dehydratase / NAD(P)H-hydrate epimerase [Clostridiales bacterium]
MKYLVSGEEMKAIDQYAIETIGIPSLVLMERAAFAFATVIRDVAKETDHVLAVCGSGNNGGDGIAIARILKEAGLNVSVLLISEEEKFTSETKRQLAIGRNLDLPIFEYKKNGSEVAWNEYTIMIDAIFGIGLSREVKGNFAELIHQMNQSRARIFSVDIPSGVDATTGSIWGTAIKADTTITFGFQKLGLALYPGASYAGKVILSDIGFPKKALLEVKPKVFCFDETQVFRKKREPDTNKGSYGKVLVIAGAVNMAGAACLCAKSAYRAGSGLVKVMTPKENRTIIQTYLPEALLATYDTAQLDSQAIINELSWATGVVIGPGLSQEEYAKELLLIVLEHCKVPCVMDADALNILASNQWQEKIAKMGDLVITPHLKEMERLCGTPISNMKRDFIAFAREQIAGKAYTLVLKDARTLVVNKDTCFLNQYGNPGMAVGGSGDILSGIIGALLAQDIEPVKAACMGVHMHARAGDHAKEKTNEHSMMAGDILDGLIKELNDERIL